MTQPPALIAPAHRLTLEARRDLWHGEQGQLDDRGRAQCRALYRAFPDFLNLYPRSSLRDFLTWWGFGEFNGKFYTWFHAGFALDRGFPDTLTRGDLAVIGQALREDGRTVAELRAALDKGGMDAVRLLRGKKAVTTVQIPASEGEAVREIVAAVSQSDSLPAPEAAARIVQAFGAQSPEVQAAMLHTHATGENVLDALIRAVDERRDYRARLKEAGCVVCGYTGPGIELHHVRTEADDRYRTHNRLVPLCPRHHGARPGDSADSIHARSFADLMDDAAFWRAAFVAVSDAAESVRPLDPQPAGEPEPAEEE